MPMKNFKYFRNKTRKMSRKHFEKIQDAVGEMHTYIKSFY